MMRKLLSYFPYFLILYHFAFVQIAYDYVNWHNGDAVRYWFVGQNLSLKSWSDYWGPGTDVIRFICFPLVKYLDISPWMGCFLFSTWSLFGFLRLWNRVKVYLQETWQILVAMLLFVLPNVHFWTSLIGKEALLFLPIVFFVDSIWRKKYNSPIGWASLIFVGLIRPHLALLLLFTFAVSYLMYAKRSLHLKFIYGGIIISLSVLFYELLRKITSTKQSLLERIQDLYKAYNEQLKHTDAYVPLEEYSFPIKIFTFYFRPLPWEKEGFYYTVVSLENLLLILLGTVLVYSFFRFKRKPDLFSTFAFLFLFFYGAMYAFGYANYGLIMRTKSLVFPFVVLLVTNWVLKKKEADSSNVIR